MMKFQSLIVTGLALAFVAPSIASNQDQLRALENALERTVRSLDVVGELEEKVAAHPREATALVISATEAPTMGEQALDERLDTLRGEVSLLRMELDELESPGESHGAHAEGRLPVTNTGGGMISTGLDESTRDMIRRSVGRPTSDATVASEPGSHSAFDEARVIGETDATASASLDQIPLGPLALDRAKTFYRAGEYEDGLALLAGATDSTSLYWTARCLTRLNRFDEAIATLLTVVDDEGDSYAGRRAETDLEFVRWKRDFIVQLPQVRGEDS